jgi:predicted MFS family arabinose efflux permease
LLVLGCLLPLLTIPNFNKLPPIYAKDVYKVGAETLGTILGMIGAGGVIGGLLSSSLKERANRVRIQFVALILLSLSFIGFALSPSFWLAMVFILLAGIFETLYVTTNLTLLLFSVPDSIGAGF